jgi:hypothetical protein
MLTKVFGIGWYLPTTTYHPMPHGGRDPQDQRLPARTRFDLPGGVVPPELVGVLPPAPDTSMGPAELREVDERIRAATFSPASSDVITG